MAIVSISKAAKLTNKSRTTKHRYIKEGKLSMCSDATHKNGIDVSELLRVFGEIKDETKAVHGEQSLTDQHEHNITQQDNKNEQLKFENEQLKQQIELLHDHVNSLKRAMLLLENKQNVQNTSLLEEKLKSEDSKKPWWKIFS